MKYNGVVAAKYGVARHCCEDKKASKTDER